MMARYTVLGNWVAKGAEPPPKLAAARSSIHEPLPHSAEQWGSPRRDPRRTATKHGGEATVDDVSTKADDAQPSSTITPARRPHMRIENLLVQNFRGLGKIDWSPERAISVIAGPNAVGKTSIFEATRLLVCLLAPAYPNEGPQVLQSTGAAIGNQSVRYGSLAQDTSKPVEISIKVRLSETELSYLVSHASDMALLRLRSLLGIQAQLDFASLAQLLSQEVHRATLEQLTTAIRTELDARSAQPVLRLKLVITERSANGTNPFDQEAMSILRARFDDSTAILTYFPADRFLPPHTADFNIGMSDAQVQLHAQLADPGQKFSRLKQSVLLQHIRKPSSRDELTADFKSVFSALMPGKELASIELSTDGRYTIRIREPSRRAEFDIEQLSSGEKGLILTFFLLRRGLRHGGVALMDEPELHLNPGVCRQILDFLNNEVVEPLNAQLLICTHSPEIVSDALDSEFASLFHLRSGTDLVPIHAQDRQQAVEALRHLGANTAEVLVSKGSVFVEGVDDVDLLDTGFEERLRGYRLMRLGNRQEVEREIKKLQVAEVAGELDNAQCFIFDNDRKPTTLVSTALVRVIQWERYCLENYLIDVDAIFATCKDLDLRHDRASRGALGPLLKELADRQIPDIVASQVFMSYQFPDAHLRYGDTHGKSYGDMAAAISQRLDGLASHFRTYDATTFAREFEAKCTDRAPAVAESWSQRWQKEADGKQLIADLYSELSPRVSLLKFKKKILRDMKSAKTENWTLVTSRLDEALR
jgi:predicted ATPase